MNLSELRTALQERREDYSASDAKLDRRINQAYLDICSRRKWGWLRREYTANTYASTTVTGVAPSPNNVSVTNGSNEVAIGANLIPSPTVLGKRVLIDSAFYTAIDMSLGGDTIILDRPFTGTVSYTHLTLPTILRV